MNSDPPTDQAVQLFITQVMYPTDQHTNLVLCAQLLSRVRLLATSWTIVHQVPLSMGFSREEDWSELPFPPPGYLPNSGIDPVSLASPALAGGFFTTSATWEAECCALSKIQFHLLSASSLQNFSV